MHAIITNEEVAAAKAGNAQAAHNVMEALTPMIGKLAHAMCGRFHTEDAISEGRVAVFECISTFDPTLGASFVTHAYKKVSMAIAEFISSNNPGPTVPGRTVRRYKAVMAEANGDFDEALRIVVESEDRTEHGSVAGFMAAHYALVDPTHTDRLTTEADDGEQAPVELQDNTVDVEETALNRVVVDALLGECNEREVLILSMTYGIGGHPEMKDQDIADALGISRPRVVTIRKAAQERLAAANTELAGVI